MEKGLISDDTFSTDLKIRLKQKFRLPICYKKGFTRENRKNAFVDQRLIPFLLGM
jgi:hypothetical protein